MRELRAIGPRERRAVYEACFREAFPPDELRPLNNMEALIRRGCYHVLGLYEGAEALAYACVLRDGECVLIDYLCVPPEKRNGGLGGELLRRLRETFPAGTVFLGESEAPTGDPEADGLILRRLDFYRRNGARVLPYDVWMFGVRYKALAWCDPGADPAVLMRRHAEIYRRSRMMPRRLYEKMIKIPYMEVKGE